MQSWYLGLLSLGFGFGPSEFGLHNASSCFIILVLSHGVLVLKPVILVLVLFSDLDLNT